MTGDIRIGTQGWNYTMWTGAFYPTGTREADFLETYARAFSTVEIDSTFYATPAASTVRGWAGRVPESFLFALKLPQEITHERRLGDGAVEAAAVFFDRARLLERRLGPVLMQLGPDFGPDNFGALAEFLPHVPTDIRLAVEFRQAGWLTPETHALLESHRVALALVDARWLPRKRMLALAAKPTTDFAYVRWMGPDRAITDYSHVQVDRTSDIEVWAVALANVSKRVQGVLGYVNNHFSGHSPSTARDLQRLLGQSPVDPASLGAQISLAL